MIKIFTYSCLLIFCFLAVQKKCTKRMDGFSVASILSNRSFNPIWEPRALTPQEKEEAEKALNQPYRYFGCGGQSFIFFSEDQNYVLKVFKQEKFKIPLWLNVVRVPFILDHYREKKIATRQDKLLRDFTSYKLAFDDLRDETGLVYVHLNPTDMWKRKLTLVDQLKNAHQVNADTLDFVIQKRAELVYDKINRLIREGKEVEAEKAITQVVKLIETRCRKGYHDRDPNIRTNCGFIGERAVKIDVGRFVRQDEMKSTKVMHQELVRIVQPFKTWLTEDHPKLAQHLEKELKVRETL
jgi:hypothetical protein